MTIFKLKKIMITTTIEIHLIKILNIKNIFLLGINFILGNSIDIDKAFHKLSKMICSALYRSIKLSMSSEFKTEEKTIS